MKIKIKKEVFEFANQVSMIEELLNLINKKLEDGNLQISHLLIDEVPVYQEYQDYLIKHIKEIEIVEVICNQLQVLVQETLISTYEYLLNAVTATQGLSEEFYQGPKQGSWNSIADLFDGIRWIIETQNRIDQIKNLKAIISNYPIWNEYVQSTKKIIPVLPDLEEAIRNHDNVLIGDLLLYEVLPVFKNGVEKLRFLIPGEGIDYVS